MGTLIVNQEKVGNKEELIKLCPFGAIEENNGKIEINAACKMCKICVKKGPEGAVSFVEEELKAKIDKNLWNGIAVYVDHIDGDIHPVTFELIGKARELADKIKHPVYAVFIGNDIGKKAEELLHYNVDKVFVYDEVELKRFKIETYTNAFEAFVDEIKPTAILVGATSVGRQLAPRIAARLKTGLTADCTILDMNENTDLVQIRPAFGGNIMAQINTPNHRPQLATVRYKIMNAPERNEISSGEIINKSMHSDMLLSNVDVVDIIKKAQEEFIENAEVLIAVGRGIKKQEDLEMFEELATLLNGKIACTRPLSEAGWIEAKRQVGLSGRTVRPKLIINCGISGAIQYVAGMNQADKIISINSDEKAPIFKVSHDCIVGDMYEIIPKMIDKIKEQNKAVI